MVTGIIGKKLGMTQLFDADGTVQPATVIKAGPCVVVQAKTKQADGYDAVQIGLVEDRPAKVNKPLAGHFKKAGVPPTRVRREVRVKAGGDPPKAGRPGARVHLRGRRARGRHRHESRQGLPGRRQAAQLRWRRGHHGSMFHRAPGSIGASSFPSRVVKGMRMAGHTGADRVTTRNLKVLRVDAENHLLIVEGAVPGGPNGHLVIRKAVAAKPIRVAQVEKAEGQEGQEVVSGGRR